MKVNLQSSAISVISILMIFFSHAPLAGASDYLAELQLTSDPDEFFAAQTTRINVKITNRGRLAWPSVGDDPSRPVRLSYHWIDADGKVVPYDGLRSELPRSIAPGESLVVRASVLSPHAPGTYTLVLDIVREDVTWFAEQGSPSLTLSPIKVHRVGGITWQRVRILLIATGTLFLLFLTGFGVARLFIPEFQGPLIPLLGVAVIIALSYYATVLGSPMSRAKWGILMVGVGVTVIALTRRNPFLTLSWRGGFFAVGLAGAMLLLLLFPLWTFGRPSTVQKTYASYFVIMSEYWKSHSVHEVPTLDFHQPLNYLVRERLLQGYVTGTPFLNAFVASTFNLNSYETYSILTALLLALLPVTLYEVARSSFRLSPWASGLAALLASFNVTYLRWSPEGQLTFIAGFLFLPLAVGMGAKLIEGRGGLLSAALSVSTLLAVYPPLVPYVIIPLLSYGSLLVWQKAVSYKMLSLILLKLSALLVLINPVILFFLAVHGISAARQVSENWHSISGYASIAELLGLLPPFSPGGVRLPWRLLTFGLVPAFIGIVGYGFYQAWKDGRCLLVVVALPYMLSALAIAFVLDYAYAYCKHGVTTLFVFLFAFTCGLEELWRKAHTWGRLFPALCGGAFFCLSLFTLNVDFIEIGRKFVSPDLASLNSIRKLEKVWGGVFIDESDTAQQLWTSYFLWGIPLSIPPAFERWGWWGFSSVFGRGDPLRFYNAQAAYTLARRSEIIKPRPKPIWSNTLYALYPEPPVFFLSEGWHELEEWLPPFRWMSQQGMLRLRGEALERRPIRLKMTLVPIVAPLTFEVLLGEEKLGTFIAQDASHLVSFFTMPFLLNHEATIIIRSVEGCFEPAHLFGGPDRRCLSGRFYEVSLSEMEE